MVDTATSIIYSTRYPDSQYIMNKAIFCKTIGFGIWYNKGQENRWIKSSAIQDYFRKAPWKQNAKEGMDQKLA
jgi:hypothetical protein